MERQDGPAFHDLSKEQGMGGSALSMKARLPTCQS